MQDYRRTSYSQQAQFLGRLDYYEDPRQLLVAVTRESEEMGRMEERAVAALEGGGMECEVFSSAREIVENKDKKYP